MVTYEQHSTSELHLAPLSSYPVHKFMFYISFPILPSWIALSAGLTLSIAKVAICKFLYKVAKNLANKILFIMVFYQ